MQVFLAFVIGIVFGIALGRIKNAQKLKAAKTATLDAESTIARGGHVLAADLIARLKKAL